MLIDKALEDAKTIELNNGYGVIVEGNYSGIGFLKDGQTAYEIAFNDLPIQLKEIYVNRLKANNTEIQP